MSPTATALHFSNLSEACGRAKRWKNFSLRYHRNKQPPPNIPLTCGDVAEASVEAG